MMRRQGCQTFREALFTVSLLVYLASGCATSGRNIEDLHPHLAQWQRSNSDPRYPEDQYLTAVGAGPDANAAANSARAALLSSFRTHIQSAVERLEKESTRSEGDEIRFSSSTFTTSQLEATVEGTLDGAQLADATRDPATGQSWALVTVHRPTLVENLGRRISDHDRVLAEIAAQVDEFLASGKVLRALDLLRPVPGKLAELEAWRTELSLVKPPEMELPRRSMTLGEYVARRQHCASEFTVAIAIDARATDDNGEVRPLDSSLVSEQVKGELRDAIPGLGLVDAPDLEKIDPSVFDGLPRPSQRERAGGANFLIRARIDTVYSSRFGALYVYRSHFTARMIDLRSGGVLVADISGSGGKSRPHANPAIAATNSLREVGGELASLIAGNLR